MLDQLPTRPATGPGADRDAPDPVTAAWDAAVGGPTGVLAGVRLTDRQDLPHGVAYTLEPADPDLVPDLVDVRAARSVIAAAACRPRHCVVVDQPDGDRLRLRLLDDELLHQPAPHPGPAALDPRTGVATVGVHADGEPATWRLWTDTRAHHGLVVGGTENEQAEALRGLLAAASGHDTVTGWLIDPYGDVGLTAAARTAMDLYETVNLISDLATLVERRTRQLTARATRWRPSPDMPLLLVTIAAGKWVLECADDTGRSLADVLADTLRQAGHVGVSVVLAVDTVDLATFGGLCGLRSGLTQHNIVVLHAADTRTHDQLPASMGDPTELVTVSDPKAGSVAYRLGSPVPLRLFHLDRTVGTQPGGCAEDTADPWWLNRLGWFATAVLATELAHALLGSPRSTLIVHALLAGLAAVAVCTGVRKLLLPAHCHHCDRCNRCTSADGVPTARTDRGCHRRLRVAGWHADDTGAVSCPSCR